MKFIFAKKDEEIDKKNVLIRLTETKNDGMVPVANGRSVELFVSLAEWKGKMSRRKMTLLMRKVIIAAKKYDVRHIVLDFKDFRFKETGMKDIEIGETMATAFEMANFSFTEFLTTPKGGFPAVETVTLFHAEIKEVQLAFKKGKVIGEEVNACRRLSNLPGGDIVPATLAHEAKKVALDTKIKVKVLEEAQMKKLGMGGVLGVGKGSEAKPKFIIMEYMTGKLSEKPIVLVGKGVTFDTGGINLKPSDSVLGMNMDMSGGAAVIHTISLASRLGLKKNIVALIPAVENMPSGSSYRPGDILRSMSGKTIEVLNTDAEGRIILADALTYAKRYDPKIVVDVATLTGAAVVALGERASALFTRDLDLEMKFREWGERSGDFVWPLPLWEEYEAEIKGTFGDWANTGKNRWGGAITAAIFLAQFAEGYPWVHLDIAPRMETLSDEFLEKGAAGASVRLLLTMIEEL